jgi:hypothetical protein
MVTRGSGRARTDVGRLGRMMIMMIGKCLDTFPRIGRAAARDGSSRNNVFATDLLVHGDNWTRVIERSVIINFVNGHGSRHTTTICRCRLIFDPYTKISVAVWINCLI